MKKLSLGLMVGAVLLTACGQQLTTPSGQSALAPVNQAAPLPLRSDLQRGTLANGLEYLVLPNAHPSDRISLQLVVHAGSLDEEEDQKGIAHLVEHMAFNGTDKFPGNGIIERQESLGMVFGRDVNAMTEYHTTSYFLHLPDNSPAMLDEGLTMLAQQASALTFDPKELELERPVVEEEWRSGLNMMARLGTANRALTLAGSRYGDRDPIGDMELVRHVGADRIQAFWNTWYHPNNMTLLVVGSVDKAAVAPLVQRHFGQLESARLPQRADLTVPLPKGLKFSTIEDSEITTEVLSLNLRGEQAVASNEAELTTQLVNGLAMAMLTQRLRQQYQTEGEYVSRMVAGAQPMAPGYSNNRVMAILKEGNYQPAMQELFAEISRYASHGFVQSDLDTARRAMDLRYRQMAEGQVGAKNGRRMMGIFNKMRTQEPLVSPEQFSEVSRRLLSGITLEQVNSHFRQMVRQRSPLVIAQIRPDSAVELPSTGQVSQMWQQALAHPPQALVANQAQGKLFDKAPAPAKVVEHQLLGEVHKWTLGNGAQVWFQPSDESSNRLMVRWQGFGGTGHLAERERRAAKLAARNMAQFGYGGFSALDLTALNAGSSVRLMAFVSQNEHGLFGNTDSESLERWLQNLNLSLTAPQADESIWQAKKALMARSIEGRNNSAEGRFNREIDTIRYANNPILLPLTQEELAPISAEDLRHGWKQLFGSAAGHQLVIVGNADPERVIDLASRYVGNLPAGQPRQAISLPPLAAGQHKVRIQAGEEPMAVTSVLFNTDYPYSIEAENQAYLLTRIVSLRLREQLREAAGGVYSSRFGIQLDRDRGQAYGMVSYSHQPQRADELKGMAMAILAEVAEQGVTQAELDKVREQTRRALQPEAISDRSRYRWLTEQALYDRYEPMPAHFMAWLDKATAAQLLPMAHKVLANHSQIDALLIPAATETL